jgi:hypothetical protein
MALLSDIITPTNVVAVAPGANGNVLQSNGTAWTSAALSVGISNVVTATGNTTLTSTPTLLRITPTNYGTTVTLPDATTMSVGTGKFTIQNLSEYHVRIVDSSKTLLGFVDAFKTVNIDLASASTSAGTWTLNNAVRLGISAAFNETTGLITQFAGNDARVIELDTDRQLYIFGTSSSILYGQVYDQTTNTFGSVTLIRNVGVLANAGVEKIDANSAIVVTMQSGTSTAQAVVLSISGTTITVNTATSFTAPNTFNTFYFFRAIPSGGFIYGYYSSAALSFYLLPISVTGTTPSFGTAVTAFSSVSSGSVFAHTASDKLVVYYVNDTSNTGGFRAFSLSGNTITSGTRVGTTVNSTSGTRFVKLTDTTYFYGCVVSASASYVGVISLSGLTITNYISTAIALTGGIIDSITVSSTKVFFIIGSTTYYNLMTFTGSAVTIGTALTSSPALSGSYCQGVKGNEVAVGSSSTLVIVDASGSSPVIKSTTTVGSLLSNASVYDGAVLALRTTDLTVFSVVVSPSFQTGLAFNSIVTLNNISVQVGSGTISWYSGNNRTPRDNAKMAFAAAITSTYTTLRKIELA